MEDQDYLLFDQYLLGELAKEEIIIFEERLKSDSVFEKEFRIYKEVYSHLEHTIENEAESKAFKDSIETISKAHFKSTKNSIKSKKKSKPFRLGQLAIAASVAILLGIFIFNQFSNPTYSDYNTHEPMTVIRGDNIVKDLMEATNAFNSKDYENAKVLLKNTLESDPENTELQLYYAITNLELDNFTVADIIFNELSQGNSAYKYRAIWYAALSQLKQKNNAASIILLKQIPETADEYKQAQKLLNKLE